MHSFTSLVVATLNLLYHTIPNIYVHVHTNTNRFKLINEHVMGMGILLGNFMFTVFTKCIVYFHWIKGMGVSVPNTAASKVVKLNWNYWIGIFEIENILVFWKGYVAFIMTSNIYVVILHKHKLNEPNIWLFISVISITRSSYRPSVSDVLHLTSICQTENHFFFNEKIMSEYIYILFRVLIDRNTSIIIQLVFSRRNSHLCRLIIGY